MVGGFGFGLGNGCSAGDEISFFSTVLNPFNFYKCYKRTTLALLISRSYLLFQMTGSKGEYCLVFTFFPKPRVRSSAHGVFPRRASRLPGCPEGVPEKRGYPLFPIFFKTLQFVRRIESTLSLCTPGPGGFLKTFSIYSGNFGGKGLIDRDAKGNLRAPQPFYCICSFQLICSPNWGRLWFKEKSWAA